MKKLPIALFLIILTCFSNSLMLVSCNQKEEKRSKVEETTDTAVQIDSTTVDTTTSYVGLNSFDEFPEEIDGPGCTFAIDREDYEKGDAYVYADDSDSIAYIKMDNRFIRFTLVEDKTTYPLENNYLKKFKSDEYELYINLKKDHDYDEKVFLKGYMMIKPNNRPEERKELYGLCGC